MTIEIKKVIGETVIELSGRLDTSTSPVLDRMIREDISESTDLILDFKELEYISSAGLRVLLGAQKRMKKASSLKLRNVCEEIMDVFEMTGFVDILTIE